MKQSTKMKRQPEDWGKKVINHKSDGGKYPKFVKNSFIWYWA